MRWIALLALGCGPSSEPLLADLEPSPHAPTSFRVLLPDAPPGEAHVEWGVGAGALDHAGPARRVEGEARLALVGLPVGERVEWRVVLEGDDGLRYATERAEVEVPLPPPEVPTFLVTDRSDAWMRDGYALFTRYDDLGRSHVLVIDGEGRVVWWAEDDGDPRRITRARPTPDGRGVAWIQDAVNATEELGTLTVASFDGEERVVTVAPSNHHDLQLLDDGSALFLSHDVRRAELGELGPTMLADDLVRRVRLGATDPAEVEALFSFSADYPHDPWVACPHVGSADFVNGADEWTHSNSLVPAEGGGWWLLARWLDALVRLGPDGEVLGQVGGRDATWTQGPGAEFHHSHLSSARGDRIFVFDNGSDHTRPPERSRLIELRMDEERRRSELVWALEDPMGFGHTSFLGDVSPMRDGGHLLTAWAHKGTIAELDRDGNVLWEATGADEEVVGRVHHLETLDP